MWGLLLAERFLCLLMTIHVFLENPFFSQEYLQVFFLQTPLPQVRLLKKLGHNADPFTFSVSILNDACFLPPPLSLFLSLLSLPLLISTLSPFVLLLIRLVISCWNFLSSKHFTVVNYYVYSWCKNGFAAIIGMHWWCKDLLRPKSQPLDSFEADCLFYCIHTRYGTLYIGRMYVLLSCLHIA